MRKLKKLGILILLAFIIGFFMSFLIHSGYWTKLLNGFRAIKFYVYPLLIILFFFLVILIHELGHFFSFLIQGVKIRAIFVLLFVFKRTKKGFKFELHLEFLKLIGGIVVPELPNVTNDEEYSSLVKKFANALMAGPVTSFFYFIVITISFICLWTFSNNSFIIGFFALNFIVTTLLTIIVMLSSKVKTDVVYGDFVAYDKMKKDPAFQLAQITQYMGFRLEEDQATNLFLMNKLGAFIINNKISYMPFNLAIVGSYIHYFIDNNSKEFNEQIDAKINAYRIASLAVNKYGLEVAYLISAYHYYLGDAKKAYETFNLIGLHRNRHHSEESQKLLRAQYEHLLNLKDNTEVLTDESNIFSEETWILRPIFDVDELKAEAVKTLPLTEYYTEIECSM